MDERTSERIRVRAYELSQEREQNGRPGDPEADWLEAEQEILGSEQPRRSGELAERQRPAKTAASRPMQF